MMAKKVTLISAEKLKEAFGDWIIDARYEHDIIATIDDQPEVKAIPIRWLEKMDSWHNHDISVREALDLWERLGQENDG